LTLRLNYDNYEKHQETGRINAEQKPVLIAKKSPKAKKPMKRSTTNRFLTNALRTLCCVGALTACSAWATLVTWQLNPSGTNGNVGGNSATFTQPGGYTIVAGGYNNDGANQAINPGTAHNLYFKNLGTSERGLGITGTTDNELQVSIVNNVHTPLQFIQLDLSSILAQGFTGGQISVGSIQTGESFMLFGSNAQGVLGTQIGGVFGSAFDEQFVAVPNFGSFQFISVASYSVDILPVAFQASITPVPEMSALFPIVGLIAAVSCTQILRRRRAAQNTAPRA
jgi:hypothetical protein